MWRYILNVCANASGFFEMKDCENARYELIHFNFWVYILFLTDEFVIVNHVTISFGFPQFLYSFCWRLDKNKTFHLHWLSKKKVKKVVKKLVDIHIEIIWSYHNLYNNDIFHKLLQPFSFENSNKSSIDILPKFSWNKFVRFW